MFDKRILLVLEYSLIILIVTVGALLAVNAFMPGKYIETIETEGTIGISYGSDENFAVEFYVEEFDTKIFAYNDVTLNLYASRHKGETLSIKINIYDKNGVPNYTFSSSNITKDTVSVEYVQ